MNTRKLPRCRVCGSVCDWVDTHFVCIRRSCGSEWDADHGPEYAVDKAHLAPVSKEVS